METAADGIITVDRGGVIESLNPAAESLFGYGAFELIGRSIRILMPAPLDDAEDNFLPQSQGDKIVGGAREVEGVCTDGRRLPLELSVSETQIDGKTFFIGMVRDITQRKEHDDEMRRQVRQRERFLAILSHELRNPMGAVLNAARVVKDETDDGNVPLNEIQSQAIAVIDRQAQHMARLLDDLLDTARITQNKIELRRQSVNIDEMVEDVRQCVAYLIDEKNQQFAATIKQSPLTVWGDPARLKQAMVNLLANAAKYTPQGGRIELQLDRQGREVCITVRDSGSGIPANMLEHLFDAFVQHDYTLNRTEGVMDIGLFIHPEQVRAESGDITVASGKNGSEFIIRLPSSKAAPKLKVSTPHFSFEGRRLLIVEDNDDARQMLVQIIRSKGFEVIEAGNGREALELFAQYRPEAAVLDIGLPEIDGYEVARQIRTRHDGEEVVLVALTGYGQASDRKATRAAGFDDHLVKPLDPGKLFKVLAQKLGQRAIA